MGTSPIKYREAIFAESLGFIGWHYWGWLNGEWEAPESNDPKASFMFTGMLDEEGKEVYDGDITEMISNFPAVVAYGEDGGTQGFYLCELGKLEGESAPQYHDMFCLHGGFKIIGNVIENPGYRWRARKYLRILEQAKDE